MYITSIPLLGIRFSSGLSCPLLDVLSADVLASCTSRLTLAMLEARVAEALSNLVCWRASPPMVGELELDDI